jgi:hypothetical protein
VPSQPTTAQNPKCQPPPLTLLPLLALLLLGALPGCAGGGEPLQTWWGPLDSEGGGTPFSAGGRFDVSGLVHEVPVASGSERRLVELVLVGSKERVSCEQYGDWMQQVSRVQDYVDSVLALPDADRPPSADWYKYVCQELDGAARHSFGGGGAYRALHALLDVTGGASPEADVFRPAPAGAVPVDWMGGELLAPATFVGRIYERSRHGEGLLPDSGEGAWRDDDVDPVEGCEGIINVLVSEWEDGRDDYPDRAAIALQSATHRYYHQHTSQDEIQLQSGDPLQVGVTLPDWEDAVAGGARAQAFPTVFGAVSRAPEAFPYTEVLMSSEGRGIDLQPCQGLDPWTWEVWPEVEGIQGGGGDDDDSAGERG